MIKRLNSGKTRKESVRNWPFQHLLYDKSFTLSPLEKTALAAWNAHCKVGKRCNVFNKETKQQLNRLIQPIEAVLLHWGVSKRDEYHLPNCVSFLLYAMHRRQTSLWAWDDIAWIEVAGKTYEEFKSVYHVFQSACQKTTYQDRQNILACAYLLCEIPIYQLVTGHHPLISAQRMFGGVAVEKALQTVAAENTRIGRSLNMSGVATCSALLANRCPDLEKLTLPVLERLYETHSPRLLVKRSYINLSIILHSIKVLPNCLPMAWKGRGVTIGIDDAISADWARLIQAWYDTSTEIDAVRDSVKAAVAKAARWATEKYPAAASAQEWTKSTAIAYVAAVSRMTVGQWQHPKFKSTPNQGKPIKAAYKAHLLCYLRTFFRDCHEWEWFPISFNPDRYLATPKRISAMRVPNPRPIAYAQWIKLLEAGLCLTEEDCPITNPMHVKRGATRQSFYPLDMIRAIAIVWLYTGLRSDEIYRLQVGCIRPILSEKNESSTSDSAICSLTIPVGKNGFGFSKPVPGVVGDFIEIWEKVRPSVPKHWDYKTAEAVDFLFVWRGKRVGPAYLNSTIIPILCRKAGIPIEDAFGKITSHRARHTLATQLSNAPTPMSDFNLRHWMGQISESSLEHYIHPDERKLQEAYTMANEVSVDKRKLEQLKEPTTIDGALATKDGSVPSVDLGHGFCTYDFFAECKQRAPCANCSFYKPKESLYSELQEATSQLQRMLHSLPLSQQVRQAVEDAIAANEMLVAIMRRNQEDDSSKSEGSAADIEGT